MACDKGSHRYEDEKNRLGFVFLNQSGRMMWFSRQKCAYIMISDTSTHMALLWPANQMGRSGRSPLATFGDC